MQFFEQAGAVAIGSRLRWLADAITADASEIFQLYGTELRPKWFPVFFMLDTQPRTITEIADAIGHTHPSVSVIVGEMKSAGVVRVTRGGSDARQRVVALSAKGRRMSDRLRAQCDDVGRVVDSMLAQSTHNLWHAISEWESLLAQRSLFDRVGDQKRTRESASVRIVPYAPRYKAAFRSLNAQWISTYFAMEPSDHKALDNPVKNIITPGGCIVVALLDAKPVGVCALVPMTDDRYDFELAKMAVAPEAQGKHIGYVLGRAMIDKARALGARRLYLESNRRLVPAIALYRKLGFIEVTGRTSPYARCDIQMELTL